MEEISENVLGFFEGECYLTNNLISSQSQFDQYLLIFFRFSLSNRVGSLLLHRDQFPTIINQYPISLWLLPSFRYPWGLNSLFYLKLNTGVCRIGIGIYVSFRKPFNDCVNITALKSSNLCSISITYWLFRRFSQFVPTVSKDLRLFVFWQYWYHFWRVRLVYWP